MDLLQGESLRVMEDFVGMLASLISTTAMVFVDDIMSDSCRNVAGGSENGLGFGGRCAGQLFVGCNFGLGNELLVVRRQAHGLIRESVSLLFRLILHLIQ